MGNNLSIKKIGFEEMQKFIEKENIIINTLDKNNQDCLINNSVNYNEEEELINSFLSVDKKEKIVIYGLNCIDDSVYKKYKQLLDLGFINVYIYVGGLFEWMLLQDIYGNENFPTTSQELDILKFKP